ncbi:MAG TPA: carboxypeptidase-like regulatory domain-containing protein [Longimicrobiales bacterium]|nr:carboxypeptidase-like regulatory domain-containing protein [Longimicrobiales bacterium]
MSLVKSDPVRPLRWRGLSAWQRSPRSTVIIPIILSALAASCGGNGSPTIIDPPQPATLSGAVRASDTQAAIAGATVAVGEVSAVTQANGSFQLLNLPTGSVTVQASAAGFDSHSQSIALQAGSNALDVTLARRTLYEFGDFAAYLPPDVSNYRGVLLFIPGSQGDSRYLLHGRPVDCATFLDWCLIRGDVLDRALVLARTYGLALMAMKSAPNDPATYASIFAALSTLAAQSGRTQLSQAPLLLVGHSLGGCVAYGFTRVNSARVIGFLSGKGQCHDPLGAGTLGALAVPGYFFIGEEDLPSREANITAVFEQNRAAGAPWAVAIEPGAGHQVPRDLGLQFRWLDAVLSRRLSASGTLQPITEASGWLGNRSTFAISSYAEYEGDVLQASWFPSDQNALDWQAFVQDGGPE